MTEDTFLTYQVFNDKNQATELADLLDVQNIEYLLEDTGSGFDASFANNAISQEYRIKLKKQDFERADKILLDISEQQLNKVDSDYYLFDFTNSELLEILTKSDEWVKFDYLLAQRILKDRGQEVNSELLETLRKNRIEELAKPEARQKTWIIAGYVFAFWFGLLGIFIGWYLQSHQKTLPNGDRVYVYVLEDRLHGKRIMILGIVFFLIYTAIGFMD